MNFIKKIIDNQVDEAVHNKFLKYGKGDYERGLMLIKKSKKNFRIKASYDWANDLFGIIAENIGKDAEVNGKIIAFRDFESEIDMDIISFSKRGKVYTAEIKADLTPDAMKDLYEKFRGDFLLLNVKSDEFKLKVKNSIPRPGGKIKDNFCYATMPFSVLDEFAFDFGQDFSEANIVNKFVITEIIIPKEYENDSAMARKMAKRKGKLVRIITVDGNVVEKEYPMEV